MKIKLFASLSNWIQSHKKLAMLCATLLIAAMAGAGVWGYKLYSYRQTANYAFEKLKTALAPPQPEQLAKLVNFNAIGQQMAQLIKKTFPFYMEGKDQERNIRNKLQNAILKKFVQKEEKTTPLPDDEQERLHLPAQILPDNFVSQLATNLVLREAGKNSAIIVAKMDHPLLNRNFTLIFGMDRTASGWKVDKFLNADEIIAQLRQALLDRHVKLRNVYEHKNNLTAKRMNDLIPVQSCEVSAGLMSDGKTLLMAVQVIGRNKGNVQINNFNVDTNIMGRNGKLVAHRFLNVAKPVAPGEDFNHRWNFELEADSALGRSILQNQPLSCNAKWQTLGLNSSEVLHILELPNPDTQCSIAGHDHPAGFCQTPAFLE